MRLFGGLSVPGFWDALKARLKLELCSCKLTPVATLVVTNEADSSSSSLVGNASTRQRLHRGCIYQYVHTYYIPLTSLFWYRSCTAVVIKDKVFPFMKRRIIHTWHDSSCSAVVPLCIPFRRIILWHCSSGVVVSLCISFYP